MTSTPDLTPRTRIRTAIFAILLGIVVTTSVVPMVWWTAKALGFL